MRLADALLRLRDRLGLEKAIGPFVPAPMPDAPQVEILYRRLPDRVRRYRQELLYDEEGLKLTLLRRPPDSPRHRVANGVTLPAGASLLWFSFPGRWYEVAAFYDAAGHHLGWYANLVRPPRLENRIWQIDDLALDVWLPRRGEARLLDREEFERARQSGWLEPGEAERVEREAEMILERARKGDWPPSPVRAWTLEAVPYLRLRRDAPGIYRAALLSGRVIGYGLYCLGAASLTVLVFGAVQAVSGRAPSHAIWVGTLAAEAALLLPLALRGSLPATRWPRPVPADERTFFLGALAMGLAVLFLQDATAWREPLAGVYATLGVFCGIFAVCRAWFERVFPPYATAGILVCGVALLVLLA